MQHSYVGSEDTYAWTGDILSDVRRTSDEKIMELAERIEQGTQEIAIKVYPDFSLVMDEENVELFSAVRFLRYSRIKVNICPYKKGQKPVVGLRPTTRRNIRPRFVGDGPLPEEEDYAPPPFGDEEEEEL